MNYLIFSLFHRKKFERFLSKHPLHMAWDNSKYVGKFLEMSKESKIPWMSGLMRQAIKV